MSFPIKFTAAEYEAWRAAQGLPALPPDELVRSELRPEQWRWLSMFILGRDLNDEL
jgi:hypothetical protein